MTATDLVDELKRRRRDALRAFANGCRREADSLIREARYANSAADLGEYSSSLVDTGIPILDATIAEIESLTETLDWIAQEQENAATPGTVTMTVGECRERDEFAKATM